MNRHFAVRVFPVALAWACLSGRLSAEDHNEQTSKIAATALAENIEQQKEHWAFRPIIRPPVPRVRDKNWIRNPVDAFVLARLEEHGWRPARPATPTALLRRMYLDLVGLPPSLSEQELWLEAPSAESFDRLVDFLLSRPGYGERWGRHWLDLVRYAETNGYERDATKPFVWRYRDYVIRSLNEDKPYDRLIVEQLAGDELQDATTETVLATGYYRLGPWDDEPADPREDRYDQLDDILNTTSQVFLATTLACARCHDHKFEPLSSEDYYRMVAIFNTLTRPQNGRQELDRPAGSRDELAALARRDEEIAVLLESISQTKASFRRKLIRSGRSQLPTNVLQALLLPEQDRDQEQSQLAASHMAQFDQEVEALLDDAGKAFIADANARIKRLRVETPDLPRGYFLEETSGKPPVTHVLLRGKASSPGSIVQPGVPGVMASTQPTFPAPGPYTTGRRLTLARWIASAENPLTSRVIVNRVWQQFFGQGLVGTASDFGVMGEPPTHPELLDWLADWFVHEGSWSLKRLHRLIVTSNSYRMSRQWNEQYASEDPENSRLWRQSYRRLEVEAIRDSVLAVAGQLSRSMFGPSMYPFVPRAAMQGHSDPDKIWKPFNEADASRRTVYAFVKRSLVVPFLEVLDLCDTTKTSARRNITNVAPQALTLFNGDFVNRQARHMARRLKQRADDSDARIDVAYRLALCRPPTETERRAIQSFLNKRETGPDEQPLVQMCRVILNLNEFVYPD